MGETYPRKEETIFSIYGLGSPRKVFDELGINPESL